ncbi:MULTISPECIES: hypothetical protein [unclassified Clostridium]|uniref:hypothetical protein n=1 Tax=unclassified Clostridium TaxID=2614128 RepID=UPI000297E47D|nr:MULTISPECIES: hypothetical protein [unclassified Clostridium]EKQ52757.1 MAG: hypothetical protein A370_04062 [Clostridium sp. Maddingley MBC34-26]
MAKLNRGKISEKIYKQLDRKGLLKEIKILRCGPDIYKENLEELYVCTIKGYYYRDESKMILSSREAATLNSKYYDKLLISYNDESKKIKQDDYFILDNIKFKIIDTGNIEDIVFDMWLSRM